MRGYLEFGQESLGSFQKSFQLWSQQLPKLSKTPHLIFPHRVPSNRPRSLDEDDEGFDARFGCHSFFVFLSNTKSSIGQTKFVIFYKTEKRVYFHITARSWCSTLHLLLTAAECSNVLICFQSTQNFSY